MKRLFTLSIIALFSAIIMAQSINDSFFERVSYQGAFDNTTDWTMGWAEWDPINKDYPATTTTVGNAQFDIATSTHITSNTTWEGVIKLDGWIFVDENVTLTINAGTIIRGTEKSALIIQRGAKIMAVGTKDSPIVFTSNKVVGERGASDWAGVIICGKSQMNTASGELTTEGGTGAVGGGGATPVLDDNSGMMKYVRIEFPGYAVATGKEINGLSSYGVGSKTEYDYIQVSYSGDDGYEWWGGTVNAKHLISYRTEDDDFDTDNGFAGHVQFAVALRSNDVVEIDDAANLFESDNDGTGTSNKPYTTAVFSNVSAFGPAVDATTPTTLAQYHAEGRSARIRRNSRMSLYNSIIMGYGRGLYLESDKTQKAAKEDSVKLMYNTIAGVRDASKFFGINTGDLELTAAQLKDWFLTPAFGNDTDLLSSSVGVVAPYAATPNMLLSPSSKVLKNSLWMNIVTSEASIDNLHFEKVNYIGAFDNTTDWTMGWAEWDPINKDYPATTTTVGNAQFDIATSTHITANTTWQGVIKLDGWIFVDENVTLTINAGTIIRGTEKSALIIQRGAKIVAVGTKDSPIVFTSNKIVGERGASDWAGVIICGKSQMNTASGELTTEGGTGAVGGGGATPVLDDNSGIMKYVRIEFPGYAVATGKEINGLSSYGVGSKTEYDYIQVSYSGDDAYEWWGGTVNAKHLISYRTEDDDFDTDNGFAGHVQFAVSLRSNDVVEIDDAANLFESDNDATGTSNMPYTTAIFSNVSAFGPAVDATTPTTLAQYHAEGRSARIRRSSRMSLYNSIIMGYGRGLYLESDKTQKAAKTDSLAIKNNIIAGVRDASKFFGIGTGDTELTATSLKDWFLTASFENDSVLANASVNVVSPYAATPNMLLKADATELEASYWFVKTSVEATQLKTLSASVYPVPVNGSANVALTVDKTSDVVIELFNNAGQLVSVIYSGKAFAGENIYSFSVESAGIYFVRIADASASEIVKVIAE